MPKPNYHVFICSQQRPPGHPRSSCAEKGSADLMPVFSQELISRNLIEKVALVATGCLGPCQTGANVLVYPGAVLYMSVQPDQVKTIVEQHLVGGEPVEELFAPAEIW